MGDKSKKAIADVKVCKEECKHTLTRLRELEAISKQQGTSPEGYRAREEYYKALTTLNFAVEKLYGKTKTLADLIVAKEQETNLLKKKSLSALKKTHAGAIQLIDACRAIGHK